MNVPENAIHIKKPVSKHLELPAVLKYLEDTKKPVIFENIKDAEFTAAGNLFPDKESIARFLKTTPQNLIHVLKNAIQHKKPYKITEDAEFLNNKERVDLNKLPICTHTEKDGGPYITSGVVFALDEEYGLNASFHRMMVIGEKRAVIRMLPRDLNTYVEKKGELEIAVCIGLPIQILLAAAISAGIDVDEMEIANAIKETEMVRIDNDILVPRESQFVLTGKITNEMHEEGPFVDLTETYDVVREQRVVELDTMYYCDDPIYHVLLPGGLEHKILMGMPREPTIYMEVEKEGIEVIDVNITPGGCSWLHGAVKIRKRNEDDGKKAILAAFRGHKSMKHVFVVDEDIDIYNPNEIEWAMATRFQGDKDLIVFEKQKGSSLDPSADPYTYETTKLGFDLTMPVERCEKFKRAEYLKININEYLEE